MRINRIVFYLGAVAISLPAKPGISAEETVGQTAVFSEAERPKNWRINFGYWQPADGVLVCRQLPADNHAAASRWLLPFEDGEIELRVKFSGGKAFHLGFDPARGTLKKKGHLYSLVLTSTTAKIMKHKDKADPKSRNETLATAKFTPAADGWTSVKLQAIGNLVRVRINDKTQLTATHATFSVPKPAVVFRVVGGDVLLDDVHVKVLKKAAGQPAATRPQR